MERLALGVDGGGTKSDAVLIDESGNILGWGRGGTGQSLWAGRDAALENYSEAIRDALGDRYPSDLWVAGLYERVLDRLDLKDTEVHFVHAGELTRGLATALETHGILVLSGTGAFVSALTESGEHVTFDGLGPTLGDRGSGHQIGLMGMRAAMTSSWGPERKTVLEELVPRALGVTNTNEMFNLVYYEQIGRSRIASAARAVIQAAEEGDRIARGIVLEAADDISETLADVVHRLLLEDSDCALVASGGIAQSCGMYWERVRERALGIAPNLRPVQPRVRPCIGAALIALKSMGVEWTPELLACIEETQQPFLSRLGG
jgi:N-acetylglucosamine kinase-like BadF-type ATPase